MHFAFAAMNAMSACSSAWSAWIRCLTAQACSASTVSVKRLFDLLLPALPSCSHAVPTYGFSPLSGIVSSCAGINCKSSCRIEDLEKGQAQLNGERQRLQEDLEEVQERLTLGIFVVQCWRSILWAEVVQLCSKGHLGLQSFALCYCVLICLA